MNSSEFNKLENSKQNKIIDCVVLNYNDAETTIRMIECIRCYKAIDHIIIVDNNSTDNSYEYLKELASDRIIVIKQNHNGGYGAGNNTGVFYSKKVFNSNYVIIANPDVMFEEKCVIELAKVLDSDPNCLVIAPVQLTANKTIISDFAWPLPKVWSTIFSAGHFLNRKLWKNYDMQWIQQNIEKECYSPIVDCVPGAMLMVRTELFCNISGYDEKNFLYWEEEILGEKVIANGYYSKIVLTETYIHKHAITINKNIPKEINRIKVLIAGRYHFLKHYTKANCVQLFVAKVFFWLCFIEESVITKVKSGFFKKKNDD